MREAELYPSVSEFLLNRGYISKINVLYGKYSPLQVDVIGYKKKKNEVRSVEVKLNKFGRAFEQGLMRMYFSDYVDLAFPEKYAYYVIESYGDQLDEYGIGLLSINGTIKQLKKPKKSKFLKHNIKKTIIEIMLEEYK